MKQISEESFNELEHFLWVVFNLRIGLSFDVYMQKLHEDYIPREIIVPDINSILQDENMSDKEKLNEINEYINT
jgi:hypothetical protein